MTIRDLLDAVAKAEACEHKIRAILLRGDPRQIVRQLEALEAMTGPEHKANTDGRVN